MTVIVGNGEAIVLKRSEHPPRGGPRVALFKMVDEAAMPEMGFNRAMDAEEAAMQAEIAQRAWNTKKAP